MVKILQHDQHERKKLERIQIRRRHKYLEKTNLQIVFGMDSLFQESHLVPFIYLLLDQNQIPHL
jgi:hypothetical protein